MSTPTPLFDPTGQVARVTGATGGLGAAIAEAMAVHGASVVVTDRDKARSDQPAAGLRERGALAHAQACGIGLYGRSNAGSAQLARKLAVEWGPKGVRLNAISPGLIRTPLADTMLADAQSMARRPAATPLRRVGEPHEVAGLAVVLASRAGAFITGHNLVVDGGTTISDGN